MGAAITKKQTLSWLRSISGEMSSATLEKLGETLPWYGSMPPGRRSAEVLATSLRVPAVVFLRTTRPAEKNHVWSSWRMGVPGAAGASLLLRLLEEEDQVCYSPACLVAASLCISSCDLRAPDGP